MPRATREQSEATERAILARARELFGLNGYATVGVEQVAAAAGVTRGAVYHHFGSKDALFSRVHDDVQASIGRAIDEATEGIGDPARALRVGCASYLAAAVAPDSRQVLLMDAPAVLGWDRWRAVDAENSARALLAVLEELQALRLLRSGDPEASCALLSGAMNEAALWAANATDVAGALARAQAALASLLDSVLIGPAQS